MYEADFVTQNPSGMLSQNLTRISVFLLTCDEHVKCLWYLGYATKTNTHTWKYINTKLAHIVVDTQADMVAIGVDDIERTPCHEAR